MASAEQLQTLEMDYARARSRRATRRWSLEPTLFIGPALLLNLVFFMIPVLFSFYLSFAEWNLMNPATHLVGLKNYVSVLKDPVFRLAFRNTIVYVLGTVPVSTVLGLGLAVLVEGLARGKRFYRFLFFTPVVTSIAVVGVVWSLMLSQQNGLVNILLGSVGIKGPNWLMEPGSAMWALILVGIWKSFGYNMVLYIPGLKGIDKQVYEAAQMDGAGRWHQFWHITLPLLSPVTFFVLMVSLINSFQVFASVQVMTRGGPNNATNMLAHLVWEEAFRFFDAGRASAAATLLFLVMALLTVLQLRFGKHAVHYR